MKSRLALAFWLLVFVGACAQLPGAGGAAAPSAQPDLHEHTFLPDGGPPVVNGLFDVQDACPFEGCSTGNLLATDRIELFDRPSPDARVVAIVAAGEWVETLHSIDRIRPTRGVVIGEVRYAYPEGVLQVGDVVYAVGYWGEGETTLWRRGETMTWTDQGTVDGVSDGIRWSLHDDQQRAADAAAGAGWWLEVKRENGQSGWTRELAFDCLGVIDAPDHCGAR
jgi:hypothetical protein